LLTSNAEKHHINPGPNLPTTRLADVGQGWWAGLACNCRL